MKKFLLCMLAAVVLPAALHARIGAYYNIGIGPASSLMGMNLELQVYNAAINLGYGIPDLDRLKYENGIFSFSIRGYTHDRESSPYLSLVYSSGLLVIEPGEKDKAAYSAFIGFRWLLNNFIFGELGSKYCITLGLGASMVQRPYTYLFTDSYRYEFMPMIEFTLGSGWLFTPWDDRQTKQEGR